MSELGFPTGDNGTGGGSSVTSVTGTAPIAVGGTATDPVIGISAATTLAAGSMSAANFTKLAGLPSDALGLGWVFGDGSDGDVTLGAGSTTMTRDMFYRNLTIPSGSTLTGGSRVFVSGTLQIDAGGSIDRSGIAAVGATAGTTAPAGANSLTAGTSGFNGFNTNGGAGQGGSASAYSTTSGAGGNGSGGTGGAVASLTAAAGRGGLRNLFSMLGGYSLGTSPNAIPVGPSGGSGAGNGTQPGGGAGAGGGTILVVAKNLILNGTIKSNGGAGGDAPNANTGGGGGGCGGSVFVTYHTLSGAGLANITATGGAGGVGNGTGTAGGNGGNGLVLTMQI